MLAVSRRHLWGHNVAPARRRLTVLMQDLYGSSIRFFANDVDRQTASGLEDLQRVAVVGSGPSGFYFARYLLKEHPTVQVDLLESLPSPFGLIRTGVAPDHEEVKHVTNDFDATVEESNGRLHFVGNVTVGEDISMDELRSMYNAVVLAAGAQGDRKLGIPGENLDGCVHARRFVNWYNGHPHFANAITPKMLDCETAIVIGQGNVALDCARVLCKSPEELQPTDIATHALETLKKSKIKRVVVAGRRGHVQGAFTMKELREVTRLQNAVFELDPEEVERGMTPASVEETKTQRVPGRMNKLFQKQVKEQLKRDGGADTHKRAISMRFLVSPVKIIGASGDACPRGHVSAVQFQRNKLEGEAGQQRAVADETLGIEEIPCGLVLSSIGYKSEPIDGVPFDPKAAVVPNMNGKVVGDDAEGLYVTGWMKRGPSGIVGTNIPDAKDTLDTLLHDARNGKVPSIRNTDYVEASPGEAVKHKVQARRRHHEVDLARELLAEEPDEDQLNKLLVFGWNQWKEVDATEQSRGQEVGKPRDKIVSTAEMLAIANKQLHKTNK